MQNSALVAFYLSEGPDDQGRMVDDILSWGDERLEGVDDYIQWLFPLQEKSAYNSSAPILSEADITAFKNNLGMREKLLLSLARLLDFYGFTVTTQWGHGQVMRSKDFEQKSRTWLTVHNHNFLRITRILKSLVLLDCGRYALAFLHALENVYREHSGIVGQETLAYWRRATTMTILVTQYSTHKTARCDCLWVSVDRRRLTENVNEHARLHQNRDHIEVICQERDFQPKDPSKN